MSVIKLNRTKTGVVPTNLADGELYIDQLNNKIYWADATGSIKSFSLTGSTVADNAVTTNKIANTVVTYVKMATAAIATSAEFLTNSANKLLSVRAIWDAATVVTIPFSSTMTLDLNAHMNVAFQDTSDFTLANPSNAKPGQTGSIVLAGGVSRTLTLGSYWLTPGGVRTVALTGVCRIDFLVVNTTSIHCHVARNIS